MAASKFRLKDSVLIVVDMQNAFCSPGGSFLKRGYKVRNLGRVKKTVCELVRHFKERRCPVVFTKMEFKANYANAGLLVEQKHPEIETERAYLQGTWDSDIVAELKRALNGSVHVVRKAKYDPFTSPHFHRLLRKLKVRRLVLAGVLTNVCLESLARSAFDKDYLVTVVREGTTTYSQALYKASLTNIKNHFGDVVSRSAILKAAR